MLAFSSASHYQASLLAQSSQGIASLVESNTGQHRDLSHVQHLCILLRNHASHPLASSYNCHSFQGYPIVQNHHGDEQRAPCNRSEEHTSELQSRGHLVCRLMLEK